MSLAPRKPNQTPKVFSTYDFEWYPGTMQFRMAGVYDHVKGYRVYPTVAEFLHAEVRPENYGRTFFAHNGGKSDIHFILHELLASNLARTQYVVEAAFNGSSAFLVYIQERGDPEKRIIFADTLFLLKASLKKIGAWLGNDKGEVDFNTESWAELRDYNEQDNRVLYQAVENLQTELFTMGGEFKSTLASCAMALFTTHYLKETLRTNSAVNEMARKSYYASRVEVIGKKCVSGNYFDVNSSFPWSMKQTLPGAHIGTARKFGLKPQGAKVYIADVTVTVKDTFLPPLPYRDSNERILFPTGTWRSSFTQPDVELLEEMGHTIEKVHAVDWFEGFTDLADYVDDLYEKKESSTGFKRELYKLLLNSLYGKFAEGSIKEKLILYPLHPFCPHKIAHKNNECMKMRNPAYWVREDEMKLEHVHVPIPATVTAYSRALLYRHMNSCKELFYCDTDSVVCGINDHLPEGTAVGELKKEYVVKDGVFAAPKLYKLTDMLTGKEVVRSKGFSRLDGETFDRVIDGESALVRRMTGIKENLRNLYNPQTDAQGKTEWRTSGDASPKESLFTKRALMLRTKRKEFPDGSTWPWTMKELERDAPKRVPASLQPSDPETSTP